MKKTNKYVEYIGRPGEIAKLIETRNGRAVLSYPKEKTAWIVPINHIVSKNPASKGE